MFNDLSDAALSPTIYQEFLPKAYDIRVTIVGSKLFAVSIIFTVRSQRHH